MGLVDDGRHLAARPAAPAHRGGAVAVRLLEVAVGRCADTEVGDRRELRVVERRRAVRQLPVRQEAEDLAAQAGGRDAGGEIDVAVAARSDVGGAVGVDGSGRIDRRAVDGPGVGLAGRSGRRGRRVGRRARRRVRRRSRGRRRGRRVRRRGRCWLEPAGAAAAVADLAAAQSAGRQGPRRDAADGPAVAGSRREPERRAATRLEVGRVAGVGGGILVVDRRQETRGQRTLGRARARRTSRPRGAAVRSRARSSRTPARAWSGR